MTPGRQKVLWWLGALLLAAIAYRTMGAGFYRLLWDPTRSGAIDLKIFHGFVADWFAGRPVYETNVYATYPPASHVVLWPLLGGFPVPVLRWCWAAAFVVALAGLMALIIREIRAGTWWERTYVVLVVLAMNAVGVCVGNGQLIVFLMPPLLLALFLVVDGPNNWPRDAAAALLFLIVLVKPSVSAPFFWLLLILARRWRPAILTVMGYVLLTWWAVLFQPLDLLTLLREWLGRAVAGAATGGYGNLQLALAAIGGRAWMLPGSLVVLLALGVWVYRQRNQDVWLLLGVAGIVARVWSYHRVYDDVLILLPAVALYRVAKEHRVVTAALLCGLLVASLVAPGPWHDTVPPWRDWYDALHVWVWLLALGYLLWWTNHSAGDRISRSSIAAPRGLSNGMTRAD